MTTLTIQVQHANPSAVESLPEDDMVLEKGHRPPRHEHPDEPERFADRVRVIFPRAATARLARAVDVNLRQAQRWMSGQNEPPAEAADFVAEQTKLLQGTGITGQLQRIFDDLEAKGIHPEVIAAQVADAYEELVGREIE